MKTISSGLTIVAMLVICSTASGAEGQSQPPDATTSQETDKDQDKAVQPDNAPVQKKQRNKRDDDIFNPSEEISEDFAVSFPVDI